MFLEKGAAVRIICAESMLLGIIPFMYLYGQCKGRNTIMLNPCLRILSFMLIQG